MEPNMSTNVDFYIEPKIEEVVYPIFATFYHIPPVLALYVLIVKHCGPWLMYNRKPFDLKEIVRVYNMIQIIFNIYIIYLGCSLVGIRILDPWGHVCNPVTSVNNDKHAKVKIMFTLYYYYFNKLLDCIETVFFVLRKKQSQISFLHVYHHLIMIYSTWFSFAILRDEIFIQLALLNSLVHVTMYSYYFLSSFGPSMQKYLWWKKYITQIQILQFLLALSMLLKLKLDECDCSTGILYIWTFNITTLLLLFINFYYKAYKKTRSA